MHVPIDRSPLHRHTELHSNDAVSVAALLRSKDFELLLPRRAETDGAARINAIDLPNIHLCYVSYGTEAILTTTPARNDYRVQLPLAGRSVTVMDRMETVCEGTQAVVSSPLYDQTIQLNADCRRLLVYFASEALTRHLSVMLGEGIIGKVRFAPSMDLAEGAGRSLNRWIALAVEELDQSDALLYNPLALAQFEQLLLTGLVCGQPHNYSEMLHRRIMISPRRSNAPSTTSVPTCTCRSRPNNSLPPPASPAARFTRTSGRPPGSRHSPMCARLVTSGCARSWSMEPAKV